MSHDRVDNQAEIRKHEPPLDTAALAEVRYHERIRDGNILKRFRNGENIADIAAHYYVSEDWVRKLTGTELTDNGMEQAS